MAPSAVFGVILLLAAQAHADSRVCAKCHRDIAANYARAAVRHSFFAPAAVNNVEGHALSDSHDSMSSRNGEYFQRSRQLDAKGNEIHTKELKIDYVTESGNHARSYLHRTEGVSAKGNHPAVARPAEQALRETGSR